MSGSGFTNDVMHAENVDFSGNFPVTPQVTADGQLLIGSTVAPNIRVATLTAGSGINITNGAGSITVATTGSGFSQVLMTVLTPGSGTYTPTAGMAYVWVRAVAGGGAAGGYQGTGPTTASVGGGGGGGAYGEAVYSAATIGASQSYTVGAAGAGASGTTGGTGGATIFGSFFTLGGGVGGNSGAAAAASSANGGIGGTLTSGAVTVQIDGQEGCNSFATATVSIFAGFGGDSPLGSGGRGGFGGSFGNFPGQPGSGFGSGGGGGGRSNLSAAAGPNGREGTIILTEYII